MHKKYFVTGICNLIELHWQSLSWGNAGYRSIVYLFADFREMIKADQFGNIYFPNML